MGARYAKWSHIRLFGHHKEQAEGALYVGGILNGPCATSERTRRHPIQGLRPNESQTSFEALN